MIINGEWKNKVRSMRANGDNEGAKRELRKARMSKEYMNASDKNKIFIDYCLAHYSYKENDIDLANIYLENIKKIFDNNQQKINGLALEYSNYLWLNVNANYENMTFKNIVNDMTKVYEYYTSIKEKDIAITALENIFRFQGNAEKILDCLRELVQCNNISDWNFVESILKDCENTSHSLYIKALDIINEYKDKFIIDAV